MIYKCCRFCINFSCVCNENDGSNRHDAVEGMEMNSITRQDAKNENMVDVGHRRISIGAPMNFIKVDGFDEVKKRKTTKIRPPPLPAPRRKQGQGRELPAIIEPVGGMSGITPGAAPHSNLSGSIVNESTHRPRSVPSDGTLPNDFPIDPSDHDSTKPSAESSTNKMGIDQSENETDLLMESKNSGISDGQLERELKTTSLTVPDETAAPLSSPMKLSKTSDVQD